MKKMSKREVRSAIKEQFTKVNKEHPEVMELWLCFIHGYMESRMDQADLEGFEAEYKRLLAIKGSK